jgi:hypothetical protein
MLGKCELHAELRVAHREEVERPHFGGLGRPAERWHQGGGRKCRSKEEATC